MVCQCVACCLMCSFVVLKCRLWSVSVQLAVYCVEFFFFAIQTADGPFRTADRQSDGSVCPVAGCAVPQYR